MPRAAGDQNVNGTLRCLPGQSGRKRTPKEEENVRINTFFFFSSLGLALRPTDPLDPLDPSTLERAGDAPVAAGREELVREDDLHRPLSPLVREEPLVVTPETVPPWGGSSRDGRWDTRGARRGPRRPRTPNRRWTGSSCDARIGYVRVRVCACASARTCSREGEGGHSSATDAASAPSAIFRLIHSRL